MFSFRISPRLNIYLASAVFPFSAFLVFVSLMPSIVERSVHRWTMQWIPSLGVELSFTLDGLSLLFCLIITGIGALIAVYASAYLEHSPYRSRFYVLFYAFMASMVGLVLADDLLLVFVFWELTTITSYLLIGFEHDAEATRFNARQALLVTGAGGLFLLVGFLLIGAVAGTYSLTDLRALSVTAFDWRSQPAYPLMLAAIFIGAFTKSAQFPFHFWLPNAMSAPTPISAFLHSATMVKAGLYLLARFHPIFGGTVEWMATLVIVGAVTALTGSILALGQTDMKKVLAYTTIMALGIITMFLGGLTTPALTAAVTFLVVHALYKSALFLVVGIVDHETGTRRLDRLGKLYRPMPFTTAAAVAAALSMAGFPLFFGFIGKEIMYKGALTEDMFPGFATAAALLSNGLMTAVAAMLTIRPFFRSREHGVVPGHEAPAAMWTGPFVLGFLCLLFGIIPQWVARTLVEPAVLAFHATTEDIQLQLWHGFNLPLLLSVMTLMIGMLVYLARRKIRNLMRRISVRFPLSLNWTYAVLLDGVGALAVRQTRFLQNGSLHTYLIVIFLTFIGFAGFSAVRYGIGPIPGNYQGTDSIGWLVALLMVLAVTTVNATRSRLLAICGLGATGAGAALFFLISGAPDVAMTQLLVETLTLVFVAIVLPRLPRLEPRDVRFHRGRVLDLAVAGSAGLLVGGLVLLVTAVDLDRTVTGFFEAESVVSAHGRNIVNVILVDFRGLDTLGEITVVATAALAAFALIRSVGRNNP